MARIKLFGDARHPHVRFISTILVAKNLDYSMHPSPAGGVQPQLHDKDVRLQYPMTIARYLDSKYPYPQLLPETIEKSSVVEMLCEKALTADPDWVQQILGYRCPFVMGSIPSLIDYAIEPWAQDPEYTCRLTTLV